MDQENIILTIPEDTSYICPNINLGQLPSFLEKAVTVTDQSLQQDMLLLSALTACSYAMPNIRIAHGFPTHYYHPSLMTLVIAPPASGKGIMNLSRRLVMPIHLQRRKQPVLVADDNQEPTEYTAFIPSNSSSAAFLKLLHDNDGRGLMMETEADALTAAWKNDFANYSYAMRQAAEHETITKARKKAGEAYLEIRDPELSVLLSGTLNQLAPLLVSRENGLASRFVCYMAEEIFPFDERAIHGQSTACDNSAEQLYDTLGEQLLRLYNMLQKRKTPIDFILTDTQAEAMRCLFKDGDSLAMEDMHLPVSFSPVVKRMAVHVMRMGAILSVLRAYEQLPEGSTLPDSLICHDDDFRTMMLLAEQLLIHAGRTYLALPSDDATIVTTDEPQTKADELLSLLPDEFTTTQALEFGRQLDMAERTVFDWRQRMMANQKIICIKRGYYRKS